MEKELEEKIVSSLKELEKTPSPFVHVFYKSQWVETINDLNFLASIYAPHVRDAFLTMREPKHGGFVFLCTNHEIRGICEGDVLEFEGVYYQCLNSDHADPQFKIVKESDFNMRIASNAPRINDADTALRARLGGPMLEPKMLAESIEDAGWSVLLNF